MRKRLTALLVLCAFLAAGAAAPAEEIRWTCPRCQWDNSTLYCIRCGTRRPEMIICPGCGEQYPLDTIALFCGSCGTRLRETPVARAGQLEGPGFDTPEEAVTCFLEGLRDLDMEKMLSVFAWETWEEHFDLKAVYLRLGSYNPNTFTSYGMPDPDHAFGSVNLHLRRAYMTTVVFRSILAYMVDFDDEMFYMTVVLPKEDPDGGIDALYEQFGPRKVQKLSLLSNVRFLSPDLVTDRYSLDRNLQSREKQYAVFGADECTTVVSLYDMDGETYYFSAVAARYGDRWYLVDLRSQLDDIIGMNVFESCICPAAGIESLKPYLTFRSR